MAAPPEPVTLSVEEIIALNEKLSKMRHDINNNLALIVAAIELIKYKPQTTDQMLTTLSTQPSKIAEALKSFSGEFERTFKIVR